MMPHESTLRSGRLAVVALVAVMAFPALAASQPGPPPPGRGPGAPPAAGEEGDLRETIQLFVLHQLRERLELSDEQTIELMTLLEERREAERSVRDRHQEALERLRELVRDPGSRDSELTEALSELDAAEEQGRRMEEELSRREESILTPRQRALRRLVGPEIHRRIEERIRTFRRLRGSGADNDLRRERMERLRREDPERFETMRRRLEGGGTNADPEARRRMLEERRRRLREELRRIDELESEDTGSRGESRAP